MASESGEQEASKEGFSEELDAWLRQRADDLGVSREELLAQLAGSYRLAAESDGEAGTVLAADAAAADLDGRIERAVAEAVDERIGRLEERVRRRIDALEAEFDEKIDEIRKHVVQLKTGVDSAAAADHDHEAFERIEELADELDELEATVASLRESGPETGPHDAETIADLEQKVTTVASAVVDLRETDRTGGVGGTRRAALEELKRQAGRAGVETADCDACGSEVNLALLTEPACPHCETELRDVTTSSGFLFDSATVGTGDEDGTGSGTPGGES